jgi:phosphate transport system substrate-binding protein
MKKSVLSAMVIAATATTSYGQVQSFAGSDTLAKVMSDAIVSADLGSRLTYAGGGSGNGEKALVAGTQGIAPMSRPFSAEQLAAAKDKGILPIEHVIGLDGIGIFVNSKNTVSNGLSIETLRRIYTCELTSWSQIPSSPLTGPIVAYRRNDASGTTDAFKHGRRQEIWRLRHQS